MRLSYYIVDVFTEEPLAGNPLAVVLGADGLSHGRMQAIAAEFNLSQTVFVCEPETSHHTAALRIFTPTIELPFDGQTTVGAAVVLGVRNRLGGVRLEEHVGTITAVVERHSRLHGRARFALPRLPQPEEWTPDLAGIATALGIAQDDIGFGSYQPALFSAGVAFHLVPVRNAMVVHDIKLDRRGWSAIFPEETNAVYVYAEAPEEKGVDFAARMFSPGIGGGEDPATGAAAAALLGPIAEHGGHGDEPVDIVVRQGVEMGRPSVIDLQLRKTGGVLSHGGIGGAAVIVAEGTLELDD